MSYTVEGVTTIPSSTGGLKESGSFRFTISVKDEKLTIHLEDRTTKHQWCTSELRMQDFVTPRTTIPQATACDYAELFVACLETPSDEISQGSRSMSGPMTYGSRLLGMTMPLACLGFRAHLLFEFRLPPIALEPVE